MMNVFKYGKDANEQANDCQGSRASQSRSRTRLYVEDECESPLTQTPVETLEVIVMVEIQGGSFRN
jgi:hypothetical protein